MTTEEKYMHRCLQLAEKGLGAVAPNPMVGAVLVKNDIIIGEGFHEIFGGPHAEVNAVRAAVNAELVRGSELYVNLEPCSHKGKTPACTDLIIRSGIKKVIVGAKDTNTHVPGNGIRILQDAGIDVRAGVLEKESRLLNKRFFTFHEQHRPYIILKWAESADGFLNRKKDKKNTLVSGKISHILAHRWRTEEEAILVGTETAVADNPQLDSRLWKGKNPIRAVIDRSLRIPESHHLFDGSIKTIVFTGETRKSSKNLEFQRIDKEHFDNPVPQILYALYLKDISSLIVEGGAKTLDLFLQSGLWDEARIFRSREIFKDGLQAPKIKGKIAFQEKSGEDILEYYFHKIH